MKEKKYAITIESTANGKFVWELPERFSEVIFRKGPASGLPAEKQEISDKGRQALLCLIQETIAMQLDLIEGSVVFGCTRNQPELITTILNLSKQYSLLKLRELEGLL